MIKTIKVEQDYYDKVKALADASGQTMTETSNGVVGAGLGEMKELGNKLSNAIEHKAGKTIKGQEIPGTDEEITITEPVAEPKAKVKADKAKAEKQADEEGYTCDECGWGITPEMEFCPTCHIKLNWAAIKQAEESEESEESEGDSGWIWVVGLLMAALALKGRVEGDRSHQSVRLPH